MFGRTRKEFGGEIVGSGGGNPVLGQEILKNTRDIMLLEVADGTDAAVGLEGNGDAGTLRGGHGLEAWVRKVVGVERVEVGNLGDVAFR